MKKENKPKRNGISRRKFVANSALAASGFMIVPRYVLGGSGYTAPSDKLNIAGIGVGGRGRSILQGASGWNSATKETTQNIVALCDVDEKRAADTFKQYPKAKTYTDFRKMLDKKGKEIDAVMIGTPDHTHAILAMTAMKMGKHVYVEKPLTHNVYEARMLTEAAAKYNLVTQMGNQGSSGDDIRKIQEWIAADAIGEVREVHCWTNRPVWPQGLKRPTEKMKAPKSLDWDLWLGPAQERPYHETYLPFSWRGWWDFGTGALGDMACHIIDPAVRALNLGYPTSVEANAATYTENWVESTFEEGPPQASTIKLEFPARGSMPPVTLMWYDGGMKPWRPDELEDNEMMGEGGGGVIFVGSKGKLMCGVYARNPTLLPTSRMKEFKQPTPTIARVPNDMGGHQSSWVEACKDPSAARPSSSFDYAGPLTEIVLMGNLAVRSFFHGEKSGNGNRLRFPGRKKLLWDGENMKITNFEPANQFVRREYRKGWNLEV